MELSCKKKWLAYKQLNVKYSCASPYIFLSLFTNFIIIHVYLCILARFGLPVPNYFYILPKVSPILNCLSMNTVYCFIFPIPCYPLYSALCFSTLPSLFYSPCTSPVLHSLHLSISNARYSICMPTSSQKNYNSVLNLHKAFLGQENQILFKWRAATSFSKGI